MEILERKINCGVFVARMQPLHKGHIAIIEKMIEENDRVLVVICSEGKILDKRNPVPATLRKLLLEKALVGVEAKKIEIITLPDWTSEEDNDNKEWGKFLYYNIVSRIKFKNFNLYYSDNPEIIKEWFDEELKERINLKLLDRSKICNGISATKIREAILNSDEELLKESVPAPVLLIKNELKKTLECCDGRYSGKTLFEIYRELFLPAMEKLEEGSYKRNKENLKFGYYEERMK